MCLVKDREWPVDVPLQLQSILLMGIFDRERGNKPRVKYFEKCSVLEELETNLEQPRIIEIFDIGGFRGSDGVHGCVWEVGE